MKGACKFCGERTSARVWSKGTRRFWTPICRSAVCWKRYWKEAGS